MTFGCLRVGNTNLRPSVPTNTISGDRSGALRKEEYGWLTATLDGYYNSVEDKIVARPTLFIWKMMNIGKVQIAGSGSERNFRHSPRQRPYRCNFDQRFISICGGYFRP